MSITLEKGPHPRGVMPEGQGFWSGTQGKGRAASLGALNALPDDLLLTVLTYLAPRDLARTAGVSAYLYAFALHDDQWRALTLTGFGADFTWLAGGTWHDAFVASALPHLQRGVVPPTPVHAGVLSDLLFKGWLCSSAALDPAWLRHDNIPRRSAKEMSVAEFQRLYDAPGRPVIITDCVTEWPAFKQWDRGALVAAHGDTRFHAAGYDMRLRDYFHYIDTCSDDQPLLLFDKQFAAKAPALGEAYTVPPYFSQDLFSLLGPGGRPDHRWLIIGPAKSGSVFHVDPNATSAFNALVRGTKKWLLLPPHMVPPGVYPSADGAEVATPLSITEWFLDFYTHYRKMANKAWKEQAAAASAAATGASAASAASAAGGAGGGAGGEAESEARPAKRRKTAASARAVPVPMGSSGTHVRLQASSSRQGVAGAGYGGAATASHAATAAAAAADNEFGGEVPYEGLCRAGEVIFVPRGWWHCVLNVTETVAVTQNFCSAPGLHAVLAFTRDKPYAVSGVPPEAADSLHDRFRQALAAAAPELLAAVDTQGWWRPPPAPVDKEAAKKEEQLQTEQHGKEKEQHEEQEGEVEGEGEGEMKPVWERTQRWASLLAQGSGSGSAGDGTAGGGGGGGGGDDFCMGNMWSFDAE